MYADYKNNPLIKHCLTLSLLLIKYVEVLETAKKFVVAKQLLRSGTSIGACSMEAQSAESKADFIHKLKIADKEARETSYWLYLCAESPNYPKPNEDIQKTLTEILKLLSAIIATTRKETRTAT